MRLISLLAVLLVGPSLLFAEETKLSSSATGLSEKEIKEGFVSLFDGKTLAGWQGDLKGHTVEEGKLICKKKDGQNLFTKKQYNDFIFRFEYKLRPGGNNGVGIRSPLKGVPGFVSMEIQILDDSFPDYQKLKPVQFNGSVYGAVAAKRGHLKPPGRWNAMEIMAQGTRIKVTLNGAVILDADMDKLGPKHIHGHELIGLRRKQGYIVFCGHHHRVEFRNIRIKEL